MTLLLFHETEEEIIRREMLELRESVGKIRRGLFARNSELEKKYQEIYFELELLKSSIAKQDRKIWTNWPRAEQHRDEPSLFSSLAC